MFHRFEIPEKNKHNQTTYTFSKKCVLLSGLQFQTGLPAVTHCQELTDFENVHLFICHQKKKKKKIITDNGTKRGH